MLLSGLCGFCGLCVHKVVVHRDSEDCQKRFAAFARFAFTCTLSYFTATAEQSG
jgi:hypothetical protein